MNKSIGRIAKYFNVSLLNAIIGVISSAVLTRVFEEDVYGKISIFTSAVTVMFSMSCMGMDSAYMRFYYEPPNKNTKTQLHSKNLIVVGIIFAIYSTLLCIVRKHFFVLFDENSVMFLASFLINVFAHILFRYANLYFRMEERVNLYALQSLSSQICSKLLIALGIFVSKSFVIIIALNSILILVAALGWTVVVGSDIRIKEKGVFDLKGYGGYIKYALIAFPNDLIFYLNTYISQYIIKKNLSIEMVGTYSALSIFISAISVFKVGFNNYWNPFIYKNYKTRKETIENFHSVILVGGAFIESLVLISSDLIFLILGKNYRTNREILGFLILGQILLLVQETTVYGTLLAKKNDINLYYNVIYVIFRICLCSILSLKWGILGIAIADAISSMFLFGVASLFGQKYYRTINNIPVTVISVCFLCIIPVVYYFLNQNKILLSIIYGFVIFMIMVLNKKQIRNFYDVEIKKTE